MPYQWVLMRFNNVRPLVFLHFHIIRDVVAITYNEKIYELRVLETKPGNAVSIIECDMNVEFAPPVGYSEPTKVSKESQEEHMDTLDPTSFMPEVQGFIAFAGEGVR